MKLARKIISLALILIMLSPLSAFAEGTEKTWNSMWNCGTCNLYHYDTYTEIVPKDGVSGALSYSKWISDELNSDCYYDYYFKGNISITNCRGLFQNSQYLTSVDFGNFDTSSVTDMSLMFYHCYKLKSINALGLDTSNVTNINGMFVGCGELESLDLSTWDLSNCTKGGPVFSQDYQLKSIWTPLNLKVDADLPLTYYDSAGNEYKSLPKNLDHSILLLQDKDGDFQGSEPGTVTPDDPPVPTSTGFTIGRDNNSYAHSDNREKFPQAGYAGYTDHFLDTEYYLELRRNTPKDHWLALAEDTFEKWDGSCYGIAATMALVYNGTVALDSFSDYNNGTYYSAAAPCNDRKFFNNIEYCYLAQTCDGAGSKMDACLARYISMNSLYREVYELADIDTSDTNLNAFLEKMVKYVKAASQNNKVLMLAYNDHCILVTGYKYDEENDRHILYLYDENTGGREDAPDSERRMEAHKTPFYISSDYSAGVFQDSHSKYGMSNISAELGTNFGPITGYAKVKDMILIDPDKVGYYGKGAVKSSARSSMMLQSSSLADAATATIEYPAGSRFTIRNAENQYLTIDPMVENEDDYAISGDMKVTGYDTFIRGSNSFVRLTVPASESFTVDSIEGILSDYELYNTSDDILGSGALSISGTGREAAMYIRIINNGEYMSLSSTEISGAQFTQNGEISITPNDENTQNYAFQAFVSADAEESAGIMVTAAADSETVIDAEKGVASIEAQDNSLDVNRAVCLSNGKVEPLELAEGDNNTLSTDANETIARMNENSQAADPADPCVAGHSYGAWTTTAAASEIASGMQSRTCTVCGHSETQTIAQLAPTLPAVKISKAKAARKSATIKWKKVSKKNLKKIKKVEIQYSMDKSFQTGVKTKYVKAKKTSVKIKKLESKKKYYVRLRAYTAAGGAVHVSKWSKVKTIKAK